MQRKYTKKPLSRVSNKEINLSRSKKSNEDLDCVAEELIRLAKSRLPNHILKGVLAGYEEDIRQDAVLLALRWYLRNDEPDWNIPRAIAAALKYIKGDLLKLRNRESKTMRRMKDDLPTALSHPTQLCSSDWSDAQLKTMIQKAVRLAVKSGRISHACASISLRIYVDEISVKDLAKQLNVHRSAIYQHLKRVRREIPDIVDGIEVPLHEIL